MNNHTANPKSIFTNPSDVATGRPLRQGSSLKRRWSDSFGGQDTSQALYWSIDSIVHRDLNRTPSPGTFVAPQKIRRGHSPLQITPPETSSSSVRRSPRNTSAPLAAGSPLASTRAGAPTSQQTKHSHTSHPRESQHQSRKKPKFDYSLRHSLDPSSFTNLSPTSDHRTPPSPLFFSNSPQPRPALPPRFSSSEAAAKMLSKAKEETSIKTVTLARGSISSGIPSRPSPRSRRSTERTFSTQSRSPDVVGDLSEPVKTLKQIGITEYLEQDERPTFIIDLGDSANYQGGPLNIIFSNSALRAYGGLYNEVSGRVEESKFENDVNKTFPTFRAWLLSATREGESMDVGVPSFHRGAFNWSCATLRKRMRIVSGVFSPSSLQTDNSSLQTHFTGASPSSDTSSRRSNIALSGLPSSNQLTEDGGQTDYFGAAALTKQKPADTEQEVLPSVELATPGSAVILTDGLVSPDNALTSPAIDTDAGFFDWTRLPPSDALPPHIQFARNVDWASTALGPIENWSPDLRQMCNLIMASPHPAAMYWGEDLVAVYNEAYVLLAGQKHPTLMGQSYRDAWVEIWDDVKDVFASAQQTGKATLKDDDCLFIMRNGFLEETYFSWSIIPMVGGDGSVQGLYNPAFEKTRRKIAERRMLTLREVGEKTASARDITAFWEAVLEALEYNEFDTPFVLLYSLTEESSDMDDASSVASGSLSGLKQCHLEGTLGVPVGHVIAPQDCDFRTSDEAFIPVFREVMKTGKPKQLTVGESSLPNHLMEGIQWRGFGDAPTSVIVCPIHPTTGDTVTVGFLVMGVNPRRPYDDDYNLFVQLLSRQLATSLASVVLFEEEIKRGQRAAKLAALDRIELSEQLAIKAQEALDSETRFTRMAEFAPVGMFIANSEGKIIFANDTWHDITKVPRDPTGKEKWMEYVSDSDYDRTKTLWRNLVEHAQVQSSEIRFKAPWSKNGAQSETWVLFSAYPEKNRQTGSMKSVFGCITDISQQKQAEWFQKRKTEEAVELKRQQENFIDITSHEMRNPLSAILQCADEIITSLTDARAKADDPTLQEILDDNIDAAQTITLCSNHQKRIVDDVLTLSKLDSALLVVTPVDAQPITVVKKALKMFESELTSADIKMKFEVDKSYVDLGVDWVRFDPSRVLQVLINLTTNAIKFTTTESKRTITVMLSASTEKPSDQPHTIVTYVPSRSKDVDMTKVGDWGDGNEIYLQFAVADSGRGLTTEEKKMLFLRFSQASPRTHVTYGGSGLGLFISRELTELQGGEIGVASESRKGSTFAFFVKARMSYAPETNATPQRFVEAAKAHISSSTASAPTPPLSTSSSSASSKAAAPQTRDFALSAEPAKKKDLKVLIVEDNLVNQRVLQKQLKNMGCEVHVANHGGEALEKLKESWYWKGNGPGALELGVVLMDQEMPVMDGLTCTKKIRELERQGLLVRHVPVIAVTANARVEQIETALKAGMDDVVSKPFRIPDLIPKIEELLARSP